MNMVKTTGRYIASLLRQIGLNCCMIDVVELPDLSQGMGQAKP